MSTRRRVIKVPDHRVVPPRSLYRRTPEEQALVDTALRTGVVWMAFGPVAGVCGHQHLTLGGAARCVEPARPHVGRRYTGDVCGPVPPVRIVVPPRRRTFGDFLEGLALFAFFAYLAHAAL